MKLTVEKILKVFRVSFDFKKLWFQLAGLIIGLVGCLSLVKIGDLSKNYIIAWIFFVLGIILLYVILIGVSGGICRMFAKELKEGIKISAREATEFAQTNWLALVFSPIALGLIIIGVFIAEVVLSFLGVIPAVGDSLLAILTIPIVILNLLLILAACMGGMLVTPIVAVEEKGFRETLKKIYEVVIKSPIELIAYTALAAVIGSAVMGSVILIYLSSLMLTSGIFWSVSQRFLNAVSLGLAVPINLQIAGVIFGLSLVAITAFVFAYLFVCAKGLATSIYLALREE